MTAGWIWQIPLWAFGAVLVWRFLTTPFALWREGDSALQRHRTQVGGSRQRAFFAARYVQAIANKVSDGDWPTVDESAFNVCIEGLQRALTVELPHGLIEAFEDMLYVVSRTKELIAAAKDRDEVVVLGQRATHNLQTIDSYLA